MFLKIYSVLEEADNKRLKDKEAGGTDETTNTSVVFSGSIFALEDVKKQMNRRLATVRRLPTSNTLEEMYMLRSAWDEIDVMDHVGGGAKMQAKVSFVAMLILGVGLTTIGAVEGSGLANKTTMGVAAFVLSLVSSFVAGFIALLSPQSKWQKLKGAALQMRSEVWKFRTRTGVYGQRGSRQEGSAQGAAGGVAAGGAAKQTQGAAGGATSSTRKNSGRQNAGQALRSAITAVRSNIQEATGIQESTFFQKYPKKVYKHGQYATTGGKTSKDASGSNKVTPLPVVGPHSSSNHMGRPEDDHYTPLTPSAFIAVRLEVAMDFYQGRVPPYNRSKMWSAVLVLLTTLTSAVLAYQQLTLWVTVVTVVGTSITTWSEFRGVSKKLSRYGSVVTTLRDVRLWWESLTIVEHANVENIGCLVDDTEDAICAESRAWVATSAKFISKHAGQGEDGESKQE